LSNTVSLYSYPNVLYTIRDNFDDLIEEARGFNDKYRSSLVLLGSTGTSTGMHLDWTEAYNIAFATDPTSVGEVLAEWTFIHPDAAEAANSWLQNNGFATGFTTVGKALLSSQQVSAMQAALADAVAGGAVRVIQQRAGDMVYVPPGWVHQVYNVRSCLKLAWDLYVKTHFQYYAKLQSIIVPLFGSHMADDYMGSNWALARMME
jgi:hypothetical protein